jgi:phosphatidylserine/phosphatidylglycerophosphate/cardiolipin synthase-like enzyme
MSEKKPLYYGTWKGRVMEAIVHDGAKTWNEIADITGLFPQTLNKILKELFNADAITKNDKGEYRVSYDIYKQYKEFLEKTSEVAKAPDKVKVPKEDKDSLKRWIQQWGEIKKLELNLEDKHFFLSEGDLDSFCQDVVKNANKEIIVVNPFVNRCTLSELLKSRAKDGVNVSIIMRPPTNDKGEGKAYAAELKKMGVTINEHPTVHAKVLVVDRAVSIVSSMNLTPQSTGGQSWEAGIASISEKTIEMTLDTILEFRERNIR